MSGNKQPKPERRFMYKHYSKNKQINQVNIYGDVEVNLTVNNFYVNESEKKSSDSETESCESGSESGVQDFKDNDKSELGSDTNLEPKSNLKWDWAEAEEENINDFKQKFLPCKLDTLRLEHIYTYLKRYDKAYGFHQCGTYLEFELEKYQTIDKKKLIRMNSCKQRLCVYCAWRRCLRIYSNVRRCCDEIMKQDKGKKTIRTSRFIFATLTTENCTLEKLSDEINLQMKGFNKLIHYKAFKDAFLGYVRALEIVVDREPLITPDMYFRKKDYYDNLGLYIEDENPNYLKCNVHIHVLLHTTYEIYKGEVYITQKKLTEMWQRACRLDYTPIVDIRSFKARNRKTKGKELAEIAKYTVKPMDYLKAEYIKNRLSKEQFDGDFVLDAEVTMYLDGALNSRRLLAFGGSFKNIHRKLKLDDEKLTDDVDEEAESEILRYYFSFKEKKYVRIKA